MYQQQTVAEAQRANVEAGFESIERWFERREPADRDGSRWADERLGSGTRMATEPPGCVLIVDDNLGYAENIAEILAFSGWSTRVAGSAEEVLSTALTAECNVLLTDFRLPGMNGVELIKTLRRQALKPVCIVMTSCATGETEVAARGVGVRLLHKPLNILLLNGFLRDVEGSA